MHSTLGRLSAALVMACFVALIGGCASPPPLTAGPMPQRQPDPLPPVKPIEVSPRERAAIHAELGAGYYERGQLEVALQELNEATKLDPTNPRIYNVYGLVYATLGDNAKAEQNFQRALALAPNDSEIRHNWGWYLCNNNRAREAIPEFEMALRNPLYKTPEVALVNAGRCSAEIGDVGNAETYFRRAQARVPNDPAAVYGLALIAYRSGRLDEARQWTKRLMQQPAPAPEALFLGMCIERKAGDRGAENSYVSQLRNRYPDTIEAKSVGGAACE